MILTQGGCVKCGESVLPVEAARMTWNDDDQPYCGDCSDDMKEETDDRYAAAAMRDPEDIEAQEMFELMGHGYSGIIH